MCLPCYNLFEKISQALCDFHWEFLHKISQNIPVKLNFFPLFTGRTERSDGTVALHESYDVHHHCRASSACVRWQGAGVRWEFWWGRGDCVPANPATRNRRAKKGHHLPAWRRMVSWQFPWVPLITQCCIIECSSFLYLNGNVNVFIWVLDTGTSKILILHHYDRFPIRLQRSHAWCQCRSELKINSSLRQKWHQKCTPYSRYMYKKSPCTIKLNRLRLSRWSKI